LVNRPQPPWGERDVVGAQVWEQQQQQSSLVYQKLLQLEHDVVQLKQQNRLLRQALCKLDPKLPVCQVSK